MCFTERTGRCKLATRSDGNGQERTMSIETQIQDLLKEAMRNKDARSADCIRMIKTKHM